jgi:hypothetical protein
MAENTLSTQQLWLDTHKSAYYLIPGDSQLPTGTFLLQTPAGEMAHVDETAVSPYQINREQAADFIETQFRDGLTQTKDALSNLLALEQEPQAESETQEPEPESTTDGAALAHDILGFSLADLQQDPDLAKEKIDTFFNGLKSFIENVTSADENNLEAARTQIQTLRGTLDKHGVVTNDAMDQLPDKINDLFKPTPDREAQFAADLKKLAEKIQETAVSLETEVNSLHNNEEGNE